MGGSARAAGAASAGVPVGCLGGPHRLESRSAPVCGVGWWCSVWWSRCGPTAPPLCRWAVREVSTGWGRDRLECGASGEPALWGGARERLGLLLLVFPSAAWEVLTGWSRGRLLFVTLGGRAPGGASPSVLPRPHRHPARVRTRESRSTPIWRPPRTCSASRERRLSLAAPQRGTRDCRTYPAEHRHRHQVPPPPRQPRRRAAHRSIRASTPRTTDTLGSVPASELRAPARALASYAATAEERQPWAGGTSPVTVTR